MYRKKPEDIRSVWGYAGYVLFSFSGRINGSTCGTAMFYGSMGLCVYLVIAIILLVDIATDEYAEDEAETGGEVNGPLLVLEMSLALSIFVVTLLGIWSIVALSTKRLHDLDRLGWEIIPALMGPYLLFIGTIWWLYLLPKPSDTHTNKYGPPPLSWEEISWKLDSENRRREELEQEALENEERGDLVVAIRIWEGLGDGGKVEKLSRLRAENLYDTLKEKIDILKAQGVNLGEIEEQLVAAGVAMNDPIVGILTPASAPNLPPSIEAETVVVTEAEE